MADTGKKIPTSAPASRGFRVFVLFVFTMAFVVPLVVVALLIAKGTPKWKKPKPAAPQTTNATPARK
ncbi:MAG: hypothetical protein HY300_01240 [Verrucomicrobia bacterium]|nr:hypothetical protein [Verrucomicrobiota bacterium]